MVRGILQKHLVVIAGSVHGELGEQGLQLVGVEEADSQASVLGSLESSDGFVNASVSEFDHLLKFGVGDGGWVGGRKQGRSSNLSDGLVKLMNDSSLDSEEFVLLLWGNS